ncbi:glycine zipper 2TM domain-containing protein [Chitinivorax sp. PXF-14]|uniref:glycine zipper 2TM domain-containing protein n=1 Tax=Chitinivorax sp. PXF-14 TaxID=3230488 RepID=UPI003467582F
MMKPVVSMLLCASMLTLGACASKLSGDTYTRDDARVEQTVRHGTITGLRPVVLESDATPIGALGGAALGGIAGSEMGRGRGSTAGAIAGVIIGGLAGNAIEKEVGKKQGVEITVRLNDGREIAVVQEASPNDDLKVGDAVRLLSRGGSTRVTRE